MTDIEQRERIDVFVGVDVGKGAHHAVALDQTGKRLLDSALPNDEAKLRALIVKLKEQGRVLLVVDQPATIGALPVAVARAEGIAAANLPGLAMRRIDDLHAGEAKTDARDAYIIAEAARSMPHTLRSLKLADNEIAELTMLCGFDDDLAGQITQTSNRIRGLLTQIHPALERVVGAHLNHPAMLDLIARYPSPAQLASVTASPIVRVLFMGTHPRCRAKSLHTGIAMRDKESDEIYRTPMMRIEQHIADAVARSVRHAGPA